MLSSGCLAIFSLPCLFARKNELLELLTFIARICKLCMCFCSFFFPSPLLPLETYEPSELPEQLSSSVSSERRNSKSQVAADLIPGGSFLPLLDTLSPVPPLGASVHVTTPTPFQSSSSLTLTTPADSSVQVKREPVSPKGSEENMNCVLQNSLCASRTEVVEQKEGMVAYICFKK